MGLHPAEVISGFALATVKALEFLEDIAGSTDRVTDVKSPKELAKAVKSALAAKQYGYEDFLTPLVTEACLEVMPKDPKGFSVDSVRVVKILGGSVLDTKVKEGNLLFHHHILLM